MDEAWVIALISAGAALAGSGITGWFARTAGARQAEAARYAGSRQADALLKTVRMQLEEQRAGRMLDSRRQVYLDFISATTPSFGAARGSSTDDSRLTRRQAFGAVQLEGPEEVVRAAGDVLQSLQTGSPDDQDRARQKFIDAARDALASTAVSAATTDPTTAEG